MFPRINSLLYVNNLEYLIGYLDRKIYEIEKIKERNKKDLLADPFNYDYILLFLKAELKEKEEELERIDNDEKTEA